MTGYALFLRGVNVGAKNSLPMAELRAMLEKIGCTDVRTYVQSGNAVFTTTLSTANVTTAVEKSLARFMGRPIATTLRTARELSAVLDGNPFSDVATNPSRLCVTFLSAAPSKAEVAPLHAADFGPELFHVAGKHIYTWHPDGQGRSALAAALAKLSLRGTVTTRNWNTVQKMHAMLHDLRAP